MLESSLIKQHKPKYNILLKDDKGYSYVRVSQGPWPRITQVKQVEEDGAQYIGPYMSSWSTKQTVDSALKIFKLPDCSRKFPQDFGKGRPCLNYYIKQCCAPCRGKVTEAEYNEAFQEAVDFIKGGSSSSVKVLTEKMEQAAEELDFERAARLRDRLRAIDRVTQQQKVIAYNHASLDVIAAVQHEETVYLAVLVFREGRLRDKKSFAVDYFESVDHVLLEFILSYYQPGDDIPAEVFVDRDFEDREMAAQVVSGRSSRKLVITVPQRGQPLQLVEMARNNAAQELARKTSRTGREPVSYTHLVTGIVGSAVPDPVDDQKGRIGQNSPFPPIIHYHGEQHPLSRVLGIGIIPIINHSVPQQLRQLLVIGDLQGDIRRRQGDGGKANVLRVQSFKRSFCPAFAHQHKGSQQYYSHKS